MELYAIRLKGTNKYLPSRKRGTAFSYSEPTPCTEELPRFHHSEERAKAVLTQWLKGWHHKWRSGGHNTIFGEDDWEEGIDIKTPDIPRKREDMELVKFTLVELATLECKRGARPIWTDSTTSSTQHGVIGAKVINTNAVLV